MTSEALRTLGLVSRIPQPDLSDPAVAEFAEQFALDVSSIDDAQRAAFLAATGDQAFAVVQQIYVHDFLPRVRSVLASLGLAVPVVEPVETEPHPPTDTWPLLQTLMTDVARLRTLDPILTELIRLRGARLHDCAVCKSRRSQDAIRAGADDTTFSSVDAWESSDLDEPTKAALGLTDALIHRPFHVPDTVITAAQRHLSAAAMLEVVLDVMRNAANKIAVALAADAAAVTDGVELFTTDADGNLEVVGNA